MGKTSVAAAVFVFLVSSRLCIYSPQGREYRLSLLFRFSIALFFRFSSCTFSLPPLPSVSNHNGHRSTSSSRICDEKRTHLPSAQAESVVRRSRAQRPPQSTNRKFFLSRTILPLC